MHPRPHFMTIRAYRLTASQLTRGEWQAQPLISSSALARQYGPSGANEAHLASQLVPMHPDLAAGTWRKLQQDLAVIPKR